MRWFHIAPSIAAQVSRVGGAARKLVPSSPQASPARRAPTPPVRYSLRPDHVLPERVEGPPVREVAGERGHVRHPRVEVAGAHRVAHGVLLLEDGLVVLAVGPQPPARVAHVLSHVLGALAEAHGIGLVHRDVKPGNVILCERGAVPDVAKVVDFGLVKDLEDEAGLSHEAALVGTPHYLAPEAIRSPGADARADLYAVGAVAYFLLTGQHVFEGRTLIEICGHHLHTTPVAPSDRLGRALPEALEAWVLECLAKDPARRPQTAALAVAALERCAVSPWTVDEARSWWLSKGRALRAERSHEVLPSDITVSRPVLEPMGGVASWRGFAQDR